jgi:hypothetical protein
MAIDPKKIREIARVCAALAERAPTAEEHDIFANLALKWISIALDRETRLAIDRFDDDRDAPDASVAAKGLVAQSGNLSCPRKPQYQLSFSCSNP